MADVQPLEAIRYSAAIDLSRVVCPPFDTISPDEQQRLYDLDPHNAVRLELPRADDPYRAAAETLRAWLDDGTLVHERVPAFYVYQQEFRHGGATHRRRLLFARVRLEPWERGVILPHERTFNAPVEDRLKLLHSIAMNTSPVFMLFADPQGQVAPLIARATGHNPDVAFADEDGCANGLWRIDDPALIAAVSRGLAREKLYVADGHHRYETALAFSRDPVAEAASPSDPSLKDFALVALAAADDPGLLVLPIHRLAGADVPLDEALSRLTKLFEVEARPSLEDVLRGMRERGRMVGCFALAAAGNDDFYLLTLYDQEALAPYFPAERSRAWRALDAAIADHVILRHSLGLSDEQMEDIETLWYSEDAAEAVAETREGKARYALLLNPISPRRVMAIADGGERMPQKSTFFYPKVPTGLLFNPLFS